VSQHVVIAGDFLQGLHPDLGHAKLGSYTALDYPHKVAACAGVLQQPVPGEHLQHHVAGAQVFPDEFLIPAKRKAEHGRPGYQALLPLFVIVLLRRVVIFVVIFLVPILC
jgi:hypothetical protein